MSRSMPSSAETINAQRAAAGDTGNAQAAETDNPGTQQRRGLKIAKAFGKGVDEVFMRDGVFGIAAIDGVAGKLRRVAKVFAAAAAVQTSPISLV